MEDLLMRAKHLFVKQAAPEPALVPRAGLSAARGRGSVIAERLGRSETVIGVQQMRGSKEWRPEEIERALSPEALTSAGMQRYHVYIACRRDLGAKFGKFSAASG